MMSGSNGQRQCDTEMASTDTIDVRKAYWDVQLSEEARTPCSDDSLPPYEAEDRLPPAYSSRRRHPPSQYLCLCGILCPLLWAIGALVLWFPLRHDKSLNPLLLHSLGIRSSDGNEDGVSYKPSHLPTAAGPPQGRHQQWYRYEMPEKVVKLAPRNQKSIEAATYWSDDTENITSRALDTGSKNPQTLPIRQSQSHYIEKLLDVKWRRKYISRQQDIRVVLQLTVFGLICGVAVKLSVRMIGITRVGSVQDIYIETQRKGMVTWSQKACQSPSIQVVVPDQNDPPILERNIVPEIANVVVFISSTLPTYQLGKNKTWKKGEDKMLTVRLTLIVRSFPVHITAPRGETDMCPKSAASGIRTSIVHEDHLLTLKRTKEYAGFTVALRFVNPVLPTKRKEGQHTKVRGGKCKDE
ncbi:hypothetical protein ARMGADRAFT_1057178 [Armillaria gallica]|uniref:Uncharacterized protein n=1 Tax=Armillaria gallica TaxID=47427 RepID=A0A2H3EML6_ARMGA|nr:hypothetical protein ARMGADRAFT_1057178 [Armillaria gallica]